MVDPLLDHSYSQDNSFLGINRSIIPFLACGDLSGFDADQTYMLQEGHVSLDPVQKPINPPFAQFQNLELKD